MPYYEDDSVTLHHGDCLDILRTLPDNSVDSVVTDPPYGIRFMGKAWDGADIQRRQARGKETSPMPEGVGGPNGGYRSLAAEAGRYNTASSANREFQEWVQSWATECLRVLKPGGHLLASGSPRTWHRLTSGIEDAGFEIRDSIAWLYGSGFPKSLDVSKAIDKNAGIWRGKAGEVASSNDAMGGPNYERTEKGQPATAAAAVWSGWGTALKPAFEPIVVGRKPLRGTVASNVLAHGTGALNINGCRIRLADGRGREQQQQGQYNAGSGSTPIISGDNRDKVYGIDLGRWPTNVVLDESQASELDRQSGMLTSGANPTRRGADGARTVLGAFAGQDDANPARGADSGGASRFFPTFHYEAKAPTSERPRHGEVAHPTVKPLGLMRWLVRLVTPPGGTVLEPFAGSGTTAEACVIEGFKCIAIEREEDYLPLIVQRLSKPIEIVLNFGEVS
jgi:DNA modification methylase